MTHSFIKICFFYESFRLVFRKKTSESYQFYKTFHFAPRKYPPLEINYLPPPTTSFKRSESNDSKRLLISTVTRVAAIDQSLRKSRSGVIIWYRSDKSRSTDDFKCISLWTLGDFRPSYIDRHMVYQTNETQTNPVGVKLFYVNAFVCVAAGLVSQDTL